MPAPPTYLIEPLWEQFSDLLPERETDHPLACHGPRIPDRAVFEKLVQVLVSGCVYERIAYDSCSESTLRRRRDEWIELGLIERLREICLDASGLTTAGRVVLAADHSLLAQVLSDVTCECCRASC